MGWLDIFKSESVPPAGFILDYENLFPNKISKHQPLQDLVFTVLDTETTGLDRKTDEIVSYGSIQVRAYRIMVNTVKEYYLKPTKRNKEAIQIHGIVKKEGFIPPKEFVKEFLAGISTSVLVAHHAGFDKAMLENTAKPFGLRKILNPFIDTVDLALRLEVGRNHDSRLINRSNYSLDSLCERYHIPLDDRHTAAGDAFLTAQLLVKLLKKAEMFGISTYGDLMRR